MTWFAFPSLASQMRGESNLPQNKMRVDWKRRADRHLARSYRLGGEQRSWWKTPASFASGMSSGLGSLFQPERSAEYPYPKMTLLNGYCILPCLSLCRFTVGCANIVAVPISPLVLSRWFIVIGAQPSNECMTCASASLVRVSGVSPLEQVAHLKHD